MVDLVATYRIQFRDGMTFDKAVEIVPYLKRLGMSHLYASPIFTAVTGSTHGYDVTNHNEIDPAIGGAAGFDRLNDALRQECMGLVLDIVPNHMAASLENDWWRSVVEHGARSPYARHFDIDWSQKLTLPILGKEFPDVLAAGELAIRRDAGSGCLALAYLDNLIPLEPRTYGMVAGRIGGDNADTLAVIAAQASVNVESWRAPLRALFESDLKFSVALDKLSEDRAFIAHLHDAQPWRLCLWKNARRHLSYRRFFEVTGLAGVRVEDDAVFDDVHRLSLELVRAGKVDGLRIDHIDGLAFPGAYLKRLRAEVGPDVPIFVEKILGEGEQLPSTWPVDGTTGYEFISALSDLFVDRGGALAMEQEYQRFTGHEASVLDDLRDAKLLILQRNFEGELAALTGLAAARAREARRVEERSAIEKALVEIIVALPVYRIYGEASGLSDADFRLLSATVDAAKKSGRADAAAIDFVADLLSSSPYSDKALRFRTKFQQLTGPVMAKAVEDTLFYRRNPLIALNEVGGHPGKAIGNTARFHATLADNVKRPPHLLATGTHDTKRGEDARARLYALAEQPATWGSALKRWTDMNAVYRGEVDGNAMPDPETEWLVYQALAGVWPTGLDMRDQAALESLASRFLPYVEKALREAKKRTDWLHIDEDYERAVLSYASRLLDPANTAFCSDFAKTLQPFIYAGRINSLSQTFVKLTAPGIPDFYQGAEGWNFSLVDPDNRRPVDYRSLTAAIDRDCPLVTDDAFKQWMIAKCLAVRRAMPELFTTGAYVPLQVSGLHAESVVAYLREAGGKAAFCVLQRLPLRFLSLDMSETCIHMPARYAGMTFRNILTGKNFIAATGVTTSEILHRFTVTLAIAV
jgi:(1->4)-alpha-D-glucan 1-alpha-D-glucosylmutase